LAHFYFAVDTSFPKGGDGPLNLRVDSAGIKFLRGGALSWFACKPLPGTKWQAGMHGIQGRRVRHCPRTNGGQGARRKVHLAVDTATSDIHAMAFTRRHRGHGPVSFRKRWTEYHVGLRIEATMRCRKALGARVAA